MPSSVVGSAGSGSVGSGSVAPGVRDAVLVGVDRRAARGRWRWACRARSRRASCRAAASRRRCWRRHLHLVDLADEQHVGARAAPAPPRRWPGRGRGRRRTGSVDPVRPGAVVAGVRTSKDSSSSGTSSPCRPGDPDRAVPGDRLGRADDLAPASSGADLGARAQRARRHLAAARPRGGQRVLLAPRPRPGPSARTGGRCASRVYAENAATARSPVACCGRPGASLDHVEADDGGRRGEHGEHNSQRQQLLTGGDETGLARAHCWLLQCGGRITRSSKFHTSHTGHQEIPSNYKAVISTRHAG